MSHLSVVFATQTRRVAALAMLSATLFAPRMWANIISYQATSFTYAASLGSTALDSCPTQNPVCVEVSITFVASTTTIVPFNVTGAMGFENFVGQGSVTLFDDQTGSRHRRTSSRARSLSAWIKRTVGLDSVLSWGRHTH